MIVMLSMTETDMADRKRFRTDANFMNSEPDMLDLCTERKTHIAQMARGKFTRSNAVRLAGEVIEADRSDPFLFSRAVSHLMSGLWTPDDLKKLSERGLAERAKRQEMVDGNT